MTSSFHILNYRSDRVSRFGPAEFGDLCDHAYNADCHRLRQRMLEADSDLGR